MSLILHYWEEREISSKNNMNINIVFWECHRFSNNNVMQ